MTHHSLPQPGKKIWSRYQNWLIALVLILIVARFVTQSYSRMLTNSDSALGDQSAFLQLGLDLQEHGVLTDGTRNPLYPAFLATFASRAWSYFTWAKLLSMAFGILAILALFLLSRRHFGLFAALAAAYLLSINVEFIVHSATALTETLVVLTLMLAWFAMIKALENESNGFIWGVAGLLAGLAYLAKGTGQLLVMAFLISAFIFFGFNLFRSKGVWFFLLGYALIATPLWLYNFSHFGSPTFNFAINHQLWMDRWTDWHPDDLENLPTAWSYLQTHSVGDIIARQWSGMVAMRNIFIKTLWPTRTLRVDQFLLSPISGLTLILIALLPLIFWRRSYQYVQQNRAAIFLTGLSFVIFFGLFSWYVPVVASSRFLLPLVPFVFVLAAHLVGQLGQKIAQQTPWAKQLIILLLVVVIFFQSRWWLRTNQEQLQIFFTQNVFAQDRQFAEDAAAPLTWLAAGYPGSTVAWGPSGNPLPTWAFSDRLNFKRFPPDANSLSELTQDFLKRDIDFVIVDSGMVNRYEDVLKEAFPRAGDRIDIVQIPDQWVLTYAYRQTSCNWCVFRLLKSNPPQTKVAYQVGDTIRLVGYDLNNTNFQPGDTLHLTLHWQAQAPTSQDYTVFTQLLGPDFQLHGQMDHQPLNNLWPTSRWRPGDHLADRYDIPSDPNAPPGEYQLLVGMYNPQTGDRLVITANDAPVGDNAISLTRLQLAARP